jgi:3-dehydro-L-gulonate 2-dehydrogenase
VQSFGFFERFDGQKGPGNLNAYTCMKRTIELAKKNTIGCVALSNTNHWMRPGNYGLMAAEENCIGILWTNTVPNMPPWGGRDARLGNNPVVFAIPHGDSPVLVDVAMSMFSYGKLESYAREGRELPVDGGYNKEQQITKNAAEILETHQCIPIGYWKGSGLSLALDLVASVLSGGRTARMVGELPVETELSQVFIAIDLDSFPDRDVLMKNIDDTLQDMKTSTPVTDGKAVYFPGENMMRTRRENMEKGIPVDEGIWQKVLDM